MRKLFIIKMKKLKDGKVSGKEEINKVSYIYKEQLRSLRSLVISAVSHTNYKLEITNIITNKLLEITNIKKHDFQLPDAKRRVVTDGISSFIDRFCKFMRSNDAFCVGKVPGYYRRYVGTISNKKLNSTVRKIETV